MYFKFSTLAFEEIILNIWQRWNPEIAHELMNKSAYSTTYLNRRKVITVAKFTPVFSYDISVFAGPHVDPLELSYSINPVLEPPSFRYRVAPIKKYAR